MRTLDLLIFNGLLLAYPLCKWLGIVGLPMGLSVALLLFVLPGLALSPEADWDRWTALFFQAVVHSTVFWVVVVVAHRLVGIAPTGTTGWIAAALAVNLALALRRSDRWGTLWKAAVGPIRRIVLPAGLGIVLCAALFWSATTLVPPMMDQDWDSQSPAYALIHTLRPTAVTDRGFTTYLADPPLLSFNVGMSALFFGHLDGLAHYYRAAVQIQAQRTRPGGLTSEGELVEQARETYRRNPYFLETRLPTLFYSVGSLGLLYGLALAASASVIAAATAAALYFTFPEVFVHSSDGGWMAIAAFFMLAAAWGYVRGHGRICFWAGFFGGLADDKTVVVPVASAASELLIGSGPLWRRLRQALTQPALAGFLAANFFFAMYGGWADPVVYWLDYIQQHFCQRVFHFQSAPDYPSLGALWKGFAVSLGLPILPMAAAATIAELRRTTSTRSRELVFPLWILVGAVCFSFVDWRQTSHFMRFVPALVVTLAIWTQTQPPRLRTLLYLLLCGGILRNLQLISRLAHDFNAFTPAGQW